MGAFAASGGSSTEQREVARRAHLAAHSSSENMSSSLDIMGAKGPHELATVIPVCGSYEKPPGSIVDILPEHLFGEILSFLPESRDLAKACMVSKSFLRSSSFVKYVKFLCRLKNVQRTTGDGDGSHATFKEIVMSKLKTLKCVERLRLEIEDEMQANRFKEDVIEKHSLWVSEDKFVEQWLPLVSRTLKTLTVIDYGQQAIFHKTKLLQLLSHHCKQLRSLELRNMFLDCAPNKCGTTNQVNGPTSLENVTTLTLRCVKLDANGLGDLNQCMPALKTLTLVTVVGLKEARFYSDSLEVLCLGLATKVNSVRLEVKSLVKLQLKMACPDDLRVKAPKLKCLAVCMDKRPGTTVEFEEVNDLKELLMGASEFSTLKVLCSKNLLLEKVFLDVPCMAFEDNGGWKGVLSHVALNLPEMNHIRDNCKKLHTLSVGPGLWYALEKDMTTNSDVFNPTWPVLTRLILHLIVQEIDVSMKLLRALVESIPTLNTLEVYVHKDSKADALDFFPLRDEFPSVVWKFDSWKKGLKFECFSF